MLMSRRIFVPLYPSRGKMLGAHSLLTTAIVLHLLIAGIEAPRGPTATVTDRVYSRLTNFLENDPCSRISSMWATQEQAKQQADQHCATYFTGGWMQLDEATRKKVCAGAQNPRCVDVTDNSRAVVLFPAQQKWSCQVDVRAHWCLRVFCKVMTTPKDLQDCVRGVNLVRSRPTETTPLIGQEQ